MTRRNWAQLIPTPEPLIRFYGAPRPGIYELFATAEDSDGNLVTSPIIRREAVLSKPPTLEFNPRDRSRLFGSRSFG